MIQAIATIINIAKPVLSVAKGVLPVEGYLKSNDVQANLSKFIDTIKKDIQLRNILKTIITSEYYKAPEFFNSTINDNFEKLKLFDPVVWGNYILNSKPKCIAPFSKNCQKEHYEWIKRVEDYVSYIQNKSAELGKVLNFVNENEFQKLKPQEQLYLIEKYKSKDPLQAQFKFDLNFAIIAVIILALILKK